MTRPWHTLATVSTVEGPLELRQRGDQEFLLVIAGRVLMTSVARRSEEALATLACALLASRKTARVLVGGLGMGFTLRAALDSLGNSASVVVAELNPAIVEWCLGPLSILTAGAALDPRVRIEVADVSRRIAESPPESFDAILLDLYEGPHTSNQRREDPFYGPAALIRTHAALAKGGVFAVWSEDPDPEFQQRLVAAQFSVTTHRSGRGGKIHIVYLAEKLAPPAPAAKPTSTKRTLRSRR